jgi:hypothetical protein
MIVMSTLRQMPLFFPRIHTAFHSYRWVAWLLACGATFWPTSDTLGTPRLVGLLVLTGVLNVAATAMAQSYVQLAQRRPWVLLFDILLGVSLIWISGSRMLPFLPYALGSLLLPAALASWRGSTVAGLSFIVLDQGVRLLNGVVLPFPELLVRLLLPLGFAHLCAALVLLARQQRANAGVPSGWAAANDAEHAGRWSPRAPRAALNLFDSQNPRGLQAIAPGASSAVLRLSRPSRGAPAQAATPQREATPHRPGVTRSPVPAAPPDLSTVLQQLVDAFTCPECPTLRLALEGSGRVSYARHIMLVKLAHEALQNVRQHAHARTATLTLAYLPGRVELSVRDDGVGLLDGTYERPGLHALRALQYRLAEMDGRLDVFEPHDGGLVVRGVLPLES